MKRALPNLCTLARIPLAATLPFLPLPSAAFFVVYALCGATDVLDGWLARRYHAQSVSGARLDSLADAAFVVAMLCVMLPRWTLSAGVCGWIAAIALVRLLAVATVRRRFGFFGSTHTHMNKCAGILLFCAPFAWTGGFGGAWCVGTCIVASLAALEEWAIAAKADAWRPDRKGYFDA